MKHTGLVYALALDIRKDNYNVGLAAGLGQPWGNPQSLSSGGAFGFF
jgi:hypothetical protein